MAISYGQFTGWVSVSYVLKSEPSCTSHKPRASYQRWQVHRGLVHGKCLHAATQLYIETAWQKPKTQATLKHLGVEFKCPHAIHESV